MNCKILLEQVLFITRKIVLLKNIKIYKFAKVNFITMDVNKAIKSFL